MELSQSEEDAVSGKGSSSSEFSSRGAMWQRRHEHSAIQQLPPSASDEYDDVLYVATVPETKNEQVTVAGKEAKDCGPKNGQDCDYDDIVNVPRNEQLYDDIVIVPRNEQLYDDIIVSRGCMAGTSSSNSKGEPEKKTRLGSENGVVPTVAPATAAGSSGRKPLSSEPSADVLPRQADFQDPTTTTASNQGSTSSVQDLERQELETFNEVSPEPVGNQDGGSGGDDDSFEFDFTYGPRHSNVVTAPLETVPTSTAGGGDMEGEPRGGGGGLVVAGDDSNVERPESSPTPVQRSEGGRAFFSEHQDLSVTPLFEPQTPPIVTGERGAEERLTRAGLAEHKRQHYHSVLADDEECQVVVIGGCAGSGKNRLSEALILNSPSVFTKVIQHTTRSPLHHEVDGRDFHFVSKEVAERMVANDEMAEHTYLASKERKTRYNAAWLERKRNALGSSCENLSDTPSLPRSPTVMSESSSIASAASELPSVFYGTALQSFLEAKVRGLPCAVLATSVEGAGQLQRRGLTALYILLHSGSPREAEFDLRPDATIDLSSDPYPALLEYCSLYVRTTVAHQEAVYRSAEAHWNSVPEMALTGEVSEKREAGCVSHTPFIALASVLQHLQSMDLSEEMKLIRPDMQYAGWRAVRNRMFGPPRLTGRLLTKERDLVFALAQIKLDTTDPIHNACLQTIYKRLTRGSESVDCPRFGPHWETIGFQGSDPGTDLRASGFLSICQLLYLVDSRDRLDLALKIFSLSQSSEYPFPFCVLSINITRIALSALREGHLTRECRREGAVIGVVNHFYVAALYHYYHEFRKNKTFANLGDVMVRTESFCKKNVGRCLNAFEEALADVQAVRRGEPPVSTTSRHAQRGPSPTHEEAMTFTDLSAITTEQ